MRDYYKGEFPHEGAKWRWENITPKSFLKIGPIHQDSCNLSWRQELVELVYQGPHNCLFFTLGEDKVHLRRESPWHSINLLCTVSQIKFREPNRLLIKKINLEKLLSGKLGHCLRTWLPVTTYIRLVGLPGGQISDDKAANITDAAWWKGKHQSTRKSM